MSICFECEREGSVQNHHVVPRSLGGTRMVPLCDRCHRTVHQLPVDRGNHQALILLGLKRAKEAGKILGRPLGTRLLPTDVLEKYPEALKSLRSGLSIRKTASLHGIGVSTVQRIKAILMSHLSEDSLFSKAAGC